MGFLKLITSATCFGLGFMYAREATLKPLDFSSRYGHGSWVIITGASDGIGAEFARQFAERGFNLVMVARTEEKLFNFSNELASKHSIDVVPIAADLSSDVTTHIDTIRKRTEGLDISVLVNNVGMGVGGRSILINTEERLEACLNANVVTGTMLTREYAKQLLNRDHRSAIINLSSIAATSIGFSSGAYSASKGFNQFFSLALGEELKANIDVLTVQPSFVATSMSGGIKKSRASTPKACVEGSLKHLGRDRYTFGSVSHEFQGLLLNLVPWRFIPQVTETIKKKVFLN